MVNYQHFSRGHIIENYSFLEKEFVKTLNFMGLPQMAINEPEEVRIRMVVSERFCWVTFMKSTYLFISMSKMISAHPRFNIWDTIGNKDTSKAFDDLPLSLWT